jgi:glycolate oxidase FAD binding subunit
VKAPDDREARIATFQPQPPVLAALATRLKAAFDPQGKLNPGRMG